MVHIIYMFDFILKFLENTGCAFSMSISTKFKSFGTELRKRKGCKILVSGILGQNTYPKGIKTQYQLNINDFRVGIWEFIHVSRAENG